MDNLPRQYYIVTKNNKDIFEIAYEIYGTGGMAGKILRENPGVYELKAGMVLNLPQDEPQKPVTPAQAMRLDFSGLKAFYPVDSPGDRTRVEADNTFGLMTANEQVARALLDLLKESGLVETFREPIPIESAREDSPDENQGEESIGISSETLEDPTKSQNQDQEKDPCNFQNKYENVMDGSKQGSEDHAHPELEEKTGSN